MAAASLRALSSIMLTSDMLSWDSGIRRFPYDLPAIVSFEDSAICESAFPSITAVHRDASLYGTKVANLLLKVLAGEPVAGNRKILTPKLIVRESTRMTLSGNRVMPRLMSFSMNMGGAMIQSYSLARRKTANEVGVKSLVKMA